jgi:hypothetical protein
MRSGGSALPMRQAHLLGVTHHLSVHVESKEVGYAFG